MTPEIDARAELESTILNKRQQFNILMSEGELSEDVMREISGGTSYPIPGSAHDVAGNDSMKSVLENSLRAYYTENLGGTDSSYWLYWTNQAIGTIPLLGDYLNSILSGTVTFEFADGTQYTMVLVDVSITGDFELLTTWEAAEGSGVDGEYPIPEGGAYHTIKPNRAIIDSGFYDRAVSAPHSGLESWFDQTDEVIVCTRISGQNEVCYTMNVYR